MSATLHLGTAQACPFRYSIKAVWALQPPSPANRVLSPPPADLGEARPLSSPGGGGGSGEEPAKETMGSPGPHSLLFVWGFLPAL